MHRSATRDIALLEDFLKNSVSRDDAGVLTIAPRDDVTALMYFFWTKEQAPCKWPFFKGALLETWRHCGLLKTVVVTNSLHDCLCSFSSRYQNVEIQVESRLVPGDINTMSIDCNANLYLRFSTRYVLIVQDDGFPLRSGLDVFVEKGYDFIGSPYCRAKAIPNMLTKILNYCPSNGGFSLRTRRMCELASELWRKEYSQRPFVVQEMSEDFFYTRTLPMSGLKYWYGRNQAPSALSENFSYEGVFPLYSCKMPFGFHTATGFAILANRFKEVFRTHGTEGSFV